MNRSRPEDRARELLRRELSCCDSGDLEGEKHGSAEYRGIRAVVFVGIGCLSVDMWAGCKMLDEEVVVVVAPDVVSTFRFKRQWNVPSRQALPRLLQRTSAAVWGSIVVVTTAAAPTCSNPDCSGQGSTREFIREDGTNHWNVGLGQSHFCRARAPMP